MGIRHCLLLHNSNSSQAGKEQDYCDSATLSKLCARTGGQYHLLRNTPAAAVAEALRFEVLRSATRSSGNEAILKVRTSQGVMVKGFLSPCGVTHTHAGSCEIEMAACDADKSICVELEIEGNGIKANSMTFFQAATLFTDAGGVRTVRISTLAIPSTGEVQDVFRSSDMDSIACVLARKAMDELGFVGSVESSTFAGLGSGGSSKGSLLKARELLITESVKILACYRKNTVASQSPKGQLILPETLKVRSDEILLAICSAILPRFRRSSCPCSSFPC